MSRLVACVDFGSTFTKALLVDVDEASVVASAGICWRAASANRSSMRAAPSSIEYSVWTCRCTNESDDAERGVELAGIPGV